MALRVVGAGLGRTGTHSLKLALEQLLGARCYDMVEVFGRPADVEVWQRALDGEQVDWDTIFAEYGATVDWPGAALWRELGAVYPDALVLLSVRAPADWWASADRTIFEIARRGPGDDPTGAAWYRMATTMLDQFTRDLDDEATTTGAYLRHNDAVRAAVPSARLLEWHPGDGWEPICAALDLPVPDASFPHVNSTAEFRALAGLDPV